MSENRIAARSLAILLAVNILNFYDRQALGTLAEPIRHEFHLSDAQLGALTTTFTVLYAIVGLPLGRLTDTWSRRKLLGAGVGVWSALTGLSGLAGSFGMLMFSRLGVAVGEAVCAPAATSWLGDLFPPGRRARALGIFMLGVPIGSALSNIVSGPFGQAFGWRKALMLAALPAIALIPVLLRMHEPERGASESHAVASKMRATSILRIPTLWWIVASGALINFNLYTLATFMPAFLIRWHGFSLARAGLFTGIGWGVAGIVAVLTSGYVGDRMVVKKRNARMLLASVAAFLAAPTALFGILEPAGTGILALLLLSVSYGFLNMYYGLVYSSIQDIVPPSLRGTTMAVYFMAMYLCGASFGPLITGKLSDMMARRAAGSGVVTEAAKAIGLQQAMCIMPVLSVALALVLYAGSRTIVRDMERRDFSMTGAG
ncbi:MAG: MFS transporter [Acidobacteriota bacterium]|nr:MFS transporter [Acidobacteriota bacterium]